MEVKNILIFPAGTEIGLEIHNALKDSKFVKLFGATSIECHADFVFANYIPELAPFADDPDFIPYMNRIIDQYGIDWIYPAHDSALLALAEHREELHCPLVAPETKTVQICRDKNKTYDYLAGQWYITRYYKSVDEVADYPVFIKPTVGQGATDARRIDDRKHLEEAMNSGVEYAVCEYLPGKEFTVDCFSDKNGKLIFTNIRMRDQIISGIAVQCHPMPADAEIVRIAEDINSRLSFIGSWFFQLKYDVHGNYKLLEIAPRIAGTTTVTRNLGVNLEMLTLFAHWGYDVSIISNGNQEVMNRSFIRRYQTDIVYDTVYIEAEDTVILNRKINPDIMRFLYQADNQGKMIRLVSDSDSIFQEYPVSPGLFRDVIAFPEKIEKKAIFISANEDHRRKIHCGFSIPVFSPDMVECLIDWRA